MVGPGDYFKREKGGKPRPACTLFALCARRPWPHNSHLHITRRGWRPVRALHRFSGCARRTPSLARPLLEDWEGVVAAHTRRFVPRLKALTGRVVWMLLAPMWSGPSGRSYHDPLYSVQKRIDALNAVMRPILEEAGVAIIDPKALFPSDFTSTRSSHGSAGFQDCIHFHGGPATAINRLLLNMALAGAD